MKRRDQSTYAPHLLVGFGLMILLTIILAATGCRSFGPLRGGSNTASLGGAGAATTVSLAAPENPQSGSTTTIEKTTVREYTPPQAAGSEQPSSPAAPAAARLSAGDQVARYPQPVRETVAEKVTTQLGVAQKDTARELGARLGNMRGVMWVGVALLIGGPIIGWKMGWIVNGMIAGGVGLLLIILATVIPGNEAWFGLGGLVIIPLVAFVYYRARHDHAEENPISARAPAIATKESERPLSG